MKKFLASFCVVALGLAAGLAMPRIVAQSASPEAVQKWEQFCEMQPRIQKEKLDKRLPAYNEAIRARGEQGYQLVLILENQAFCYARQGR
jgi:hypothetical protein